MSRSAAAAALAAVFLSFWAGPVAARSSDVSAGGRARPVVPDSYTLGPYHYVCPPHFQKYTNIQPAATVQKVPLKGPSSLSVAVAPSDAQISIELLKSMAATFGTPAGQTTVQFSIRASRRCRAGRPRGLKVDGDVYGLNFRFEPSLGPIHSAHKDVLIYMDAPHNTPSNLMLGRFGASNRWRPVCTRSSMLLIQGLPACLTKRLPREAAIFYNPHSHYGSKGNHATKKGKHASQGVSPFIIAAIVIVAAWVALLLFLFVRGRASGTSR